MIVVLCQHFTNFATDAQKLQRHALSKCVTQDKKGPLATRLQEQVLMSIQNAVSRTFKSA